MKLPSLPQPAPLKQLVRDILILQEQLNNPETRSFYFRQALERNQEKQKELHSQFEDIRSFFNSTSLDELIEKVQQTKNTQNRIDKLQSRTIRELASRSNKHQINYLEELISLKKQLPILLPFEKLDKSIAFE